MQLGHVFSPSLDDLYKDEKFLIYLEAQIISLCSVATIHSEKIKNADSIGELVSKCECVHYGSTAEFFIFISKH